MIGFYSTSFLCTHLSLYHSSCDISSQSSSFAYLCICTRAAYQLLRELMKALKVAIFVCLAIRKLYFYHSFVTESTKWKKAVLFTGPSCHAWEIQYTEYRVGALHSADALSQGWEKGTPFMICLKTMGKCYSKSWYSGRGILVTVKYGNSS